MKLAALVGLSPIAADATGVTLPPWMYLVLALFGSGALWRFYFRRLETRLKGSEADKNEADAASVLSSASRELVAPFREANADLQAMLRDQRAEIRAKEVMVAEARAEVAELTAQIARIQQVEGDKRHEAVNNAVAQAGVMAREYTEEIARLKAELAQRGGLERRQPRP